MSNNCSSSSHFLKSFQAESPSSDSSINGAELKEGAAQFPPGQPPSPELPDVAPGQENDKTDRRRLLLAGSTTPHPVSPTLSPQCSLSRNSPRGSPHRSPIKPFTNCPSRSTKSVKREPKSRSQCTSLGSPLPPAVQISSSSLVLPKSTRSVSCTSFGGALPTQSCTLVPEACGQCNDELTFNGRSLVAQQTTIQPIVDNDLYVQQCMIRKGAWSISDKAKARISMKMEGEPLIDGHPIATCILKKFQSNFVSYRGDIASRRGNPKPTFTAELCTTQNRVLLPYLMDSSIEKLEKEFADQFQQTRHSITLARDSQRDVTIPILVAIMYRSAFVVSISFEHFVNSRCPHCVPYRRQVQFTVKKLKEAHDTTCRKLQCIAKNRNREESWKEIVTACEKVNIIYEVFKMQEARRWLIEYPHFVEIHLRSSDTTIRCLYKQIPPFCSAVPLFESNGNRDSVSYELLKSHFTQAVREINKELLGERERFFKRKPELRAENLGLIFPYRFDSEADCRYLHITIDT